VRTLRASAADRRASRRCFCRWLLTWSTVRSSTCAGEQWLELSGWEPVGVRTICLKLVSKTLFPLSTAEDENVDPHVDHTM